MGWEHAREYGDDWGSETEDSISAKVPEPPRKENRMGFWTEWALQCYRAVMFPVHCLLGLEAYAVDIRYISPQDDWGDYIYGYECNCPDQDCEECRDQ